MTDELTKIPSSFPAGVSVSYRRVFANYPADQGWAMQLFLRGPAVITKDADVAGSAFIVELTPEETSTLLPGIYYWAERVTDGDQVVEVATGRLEVTIDFTAIGTIVSKAAKWLPIVEAAIEGQLTDGIREYQILGRSVSKYTITELFRVRSYLLACLRQQRTGRLSRAVKVCFTRPGIR